MRRKYSKASFTSKSLARLFREYRSYLFNSVLDKEEMLPLDLFYKKMRVNKILPRSFTYEEYLTNLSKKDKNV